MGQKKNRNSAEVRDDVATYFNRYGYEALGYALAEMILNNEIILTQEQTESLWEYGGNPGPRD